MKIFTEAHLRLVGRDCANDLLRGGSEFVSAWENGDLLPRSYFEMGVGGTISIPGCLWEDLRRPGLFGSGYVSNSIAGSGTPSFRRSTEIPGQPTNEPSWIECPTCGTDIRLNEDRNLWCQNCGTLDFGSSDPRSRTRWLYWAVFVRPPQADEFE
jgi:hypothetical protein